MRKHFVQFFSPGTFVSETSEKPIDEWDTHLACAIAKTIQERHGARPYGFQFVTKLVGEPVADGEGGQLKVTPKEVERSGMHYITGKLLFFHELGGLGGEILQSNMRCNNWPICVENHNSYRHTGTFEERDKIVDLEGRVLRSGDERDLVEYRASTIASWNAEREAARA